MVAGRGWDLIGPHPAIADWARVASVAASRILDHSEEEWRSGGTWFVGVDALCNDPDGAVAGVALPWSVLGLAPTALHRAQLSVIRPGYPLRSEGESEAAHAFRRDRDAAHLDGLIAEGPDKRRYLREPHAWVLGVPLSGCAEDRSPLVVWEHSSDVMRRRLAPILRQDPGADLTEAYQAARREVFATCKRIELVALPGQATLIHRMTLHGVAPWRAPQGSAEPRVIAYFRPQLVSVAEWVQSD
jgi:hypothetical protein